MHQSANFAVIIRKIVLLHFELKEQPYEKFQINTALRGSDYDRRLLRSEERNPEGRYP